MTQSIHLCLEPPPDTNTTTTSDPLHTRRKLVAIGVRGEHIYQDEAQVLAPLSNKLVKLWAERGDFSRFRSDDLTVSKGSSTSRGQDGEEVVIKEDSAQDSDDDEDDATAATLEPSHAPNPSNTISALQDSNNSSSAAARSQQQQHEGMLTISEMIMLKEQMLEQLNSAQHAAHFSTMLLAMLLSSAKPPPTTAATPAGAGGAGSLLAAAAAARAASPAPGGGADGASSAGGGAGHAASVAGGADDLLSSWGLDPLVVNVSKLSLQQDPSSAFASSSSGFEPTRSTTGTGGATGEKNKEIQHEEYPPAKVSVLKSRYELARDRAQALGAKREGIRSTMEILRAGAKQMQRAIGEDFAAGADQEQGEGDEPKAMTRQALAEKIRWEGLRRLRSSGSAWGVRGGKPIEAEWRATEGLLVQGLPPNFGKEGEEARDAWIGWGVPECEYFRNPERAWRRGRLIHFSDSIWRDGNSSSALSS